MKAIQAPTLNGGGAATAVAARPARKPPKRPELREPRNLLEAVLFAATDPTLDIGRVQQLIAMRSEMEKAEALRLYNAALVACQTELVPVAKNRANEQTNSRYADLAAIAEASLPIIHRNGFGVSFGEAPTEKPGHLGVDVRICHSAGHVERMTFHLPSDMVGFKGTANKTAIHGYGSALTYARRYSLLSAFNIIVAGDDDGQAAGAKPASSASLKRSGVWSEFERDMRGARSLQELEAVCERWRPRMVNWSHGYKTGAVELKGQCIEALGGTLAQLEESAQALDHDRERYQASIAEDRHHQGDFTRTYLSKPWR